MGVDNMKELSNIVKLLGEENEKKLKDSITDLLIERVDEDLRDMCTYIIDFEETFDQIRKDVEKDVKEMMYRKYMDKMEQKMNELLNM